MYDGIYLAVFTLSVLPFLFIGKYKKRLQKGSYWRIVAQMSAFHVVFPVFVLMLTRVLFKTPLWVVKAFVPDLFVVIIISACLLFAGGIVKMILFIRYFLAALYECH